MRTEIKVITPQYAEHLLGANSNNRKLRKPYVTYLAGLLERGEWILTHQGIAFSTDGVLLDGQHRLTAIVKSGIPAKMSITWGCDPKSFKALDSGLVRGMTDHTGFCNIIAAALRLAILIRDGGKQIGLRVSPDQIEEMAETSLGNAILHIRKHCSSTSRGFSSAPALLCAASMLSHYTKKGDDEAVSYVLNTYKNLVTGKFSLAPQSANRYIKAVSDNLVTTKAKHCFFGMRVYDYDLRDASMYRITDATVSESWEKLREMVVKYSQTRVPQHSENAA